MKRFYAFALAAMLLLSITMVANAANIPTVVNEDEPCVWTETVYNGSGSDIATARVVQWDFDTSNPSGTYYDDMTNYVKLADGTDDIWTAGVTMVSRGISNGAFGQLIIRGPAIVYKSTNTINAGEIVGCDTSGYATDWTGSGENTSVGVAIKVDHPIHGQHAIVYVNPTTFD